MRFPATIIAVVFLQFASCVAYGQSTKTGQPDPAKRPDDNQSKRAKTKSAKDLEAERVRNERRANAQSLLVALASDATRFNDSTLRVRTLARVADQLWEADRQRARAMFRDAWDATKTAEKEARERPGQERQSLAKTGFSSAPSPTDVRREVLNLATRCDRALGEEFLAKLKEQSEQENAGRKNSGTAPMGNIDVLAIQRLEVARHLLTADQTEQALQFADPVLSMITMWTVDFLCSVREKDSPAADARYAAMLANASANPESDANTTSVLASYLFTPHFFITFTADGTMTRLFEGNTVAPVVDPPLRVAFLRTAANILLRPPASPGQEQNSAGHNLHYLMIKRLLPLFENYAPPELTSALRSQAEALSPVVSQATRDRDDDDWVHMGMRPDKVEENREQSLLDRLDRAKTSDERDHLHYRLASFYAARGELKARDYVDKIDETELRNIARKSIDIQLGRYAVSKKDVDRILELFRTGQLPHIYKTHLLSQAAKLLAKSDQEKARVLIDLAAAEARRIQASDPESPRAFLAVANAMLSVNPAAVWDAMNEAVRASNSAESFSGEGGQLFHRVNTKEMSYGYRESVPDFDLEGIFKTLTEQNYDKVVELAQGFTRQAPRAVATIAIARTVLEDKKK